MKPEPLLHTAPPLAEALVQVLEQAPSGLVGLMGRPSLVSRLEQAGRVVELLQPASHGFVPEGAPLAALLLVGQVKRLPSDRVRGVLKTWALRLRPSGLLVTAEPGAEGRVGGWLFGLGRKLRGRGALPPWSLTSLMLDLGVAPVRQVWPQGVGAWVLTWGPLVPLALRKQPLDGSEGTS